MTMYRRGSTLEEVEMPDAPLRVMPNDAAVEKTLPATLA